MSDTALLVVDDEAVNLEILTEVLGAAGYQVDVATDGLEAWHRIETAPERYEAILLDRMMPGINGLDLLIKVKGDPAYATIPVILQTARAARADILEGLKAGAHYYLCKPYDDEALLAVVAIATQDFRRYRRVREDVAAAANTFQLLERGTFRFRTLAEARALTVLLAKLSPTPDLLAIGLQELLVNAVEHGNLGLSYADKTKLQQENQWESEVERRLALAENAHKFATVEVERSAGTLHFRVVDQGQGFDWRDYLEVSASRAFDSHGRGIALARQLSFSCLEYRGHGNEVLAVAKL